MPLRMKRLLASGRMFLKAFSSAEQEAGSGRADMASSV